MNRIALIAAVMGFFAIAIVAWLGGCSTFRCAVRGVAAAAAIYMGTRVALKLVVNIVADAAVKARLARQQEAEKTQT